MVIDSANSLKDEQFIYFYIIKFQLRPARNIKCGNVEKMCLSVCNFDWPFSGDCSCNYVLVTEGQSIRLGLNSVIRNSDFVRSLSLEIRLTKWLVNQKTFISQLK